MKKIELTEEELKTLSNLMDDYQSNIRDNYIIDNEFQINCETINPTNTLEDIKHKLNKAYYA